MTNTDITRPPSLAQQVHQAFHRRLREGRYSPGERIVIDRLAAELGVSLTPVREALSQLKHDGILIDDDFGRARITPLTQKYVRDTYQVRAQLDALACELYCGVSDQETLKLIEESVEIARDVITGTNFDADLLISGDETFHGVILNHCGNPVLQRELTSLQVHIDYIRSFSLRRRGEHMKVSLVEHAEILQSLKDGDAKRAGAAMRDHIIASGERIVQLLVEIDTRSQAAACS